MRIATSDAAQLCRRDRGARHESVPVSKGRDVFGGVPSRRGKNIVPCALCRCLSSQWITCNGRAGRDKRTMMSSNCAIHLGNLYARFFLGITWVDALFVCVILDNGLFMRICGLHMKWVMFFIPNL